MPDLSRIASRIYNRPLLIHPSTAAVVTAGLGDRFGVMAGPELEALLPSASRFRGSPSANGGSYRVESGRAIITVTGELCNRGAWVGASSGLTSYEGIAAQLKAALADPSVSAIVLDLDTPGGEAIGAFEAAAEVRAASARKPITAFVNGMAASAGYALAAAANRIVMTPSAVVGSIGVVMLHIDQSKKLEKQGLKPTFVFAGSHKVDGHSFGPLPDAVKADLQAEVAKFYDMFVGTVARYRNMSTDAVKATEARCFMGAEAVKAGLADAIGTLDDALAAKPGFQTSAAPAGVGLHTAVAPSPGAAISTSSSATSFDAIVARNKAAMAGGALPSVTTGAKGPVTVSAPVWDDIITSLNVAHGLQRDDQTKPTPPPAARPTGLWDEVVADLNNSRGVKTTAPRSSSADLWDEVVAEVSKPSRGVAS